MRKRTEGKACSVAIEEGAVDWPDGGSPGRRLEGRHSRWRVSPANACPTFPDFADPRADRVRVALVFHHYCAAQLHGKADSGLRQPFPAAEANFLAAGARVSWGRAGCLHFRFALHRAALERLAARLLRRHRGKAATEAAVWSARAPADVGGAGPSGEPAVGSPYDHRLGSGRVGRAGVECWSGVLESSAGGGLAAPISLRTSECAVLACRRRSGRVSVCRKPIV
ncbi:MAG: hypothetical protein RL685_1098 [Pseudomonadota bacterium]|jgi:hypothetical protein